MLGIEEVGVADLMRGVDGEGGVGGGGEREWGEGGDPAV